jgi:hypothetical protein
VVSKTSYGFFYPTFGSTILLLRDVIAGRYCGVLLQYVIADVVAGHYLIAGHYCRVIAWRYFGTLLRDVIAGRYCGTLLRDDIAGRYCGTLLRDIVGHYSRVLRHVSA